MKQTIKIDNKCFTLEASFRSKNLLLTTAKNYSSMGFLTTWESTKKFGIVYYHLYIHKLKLKKDEVLRNAKIIQKTTINKKKKLRGKIFHLIALSKSKTAILKEKQKYKNTHYTQVFESKHNWQLFICRKHRKPT